MAVVLALVGLGNLALRDWDEGIVAGVSLALSRAHGPDVLLPTYWGEPYLNKPPGIHLLIAAVITLWRQLSGAVADALPPEMVVRLAPALLSTAVVPLVGLVQLRLRPHDRLAAVASAAIALTLLPLARHGRMAMLDGSQVAALLLLWWGLLAKRGFVAGLAGSALLLLKAPVAIPALLSGLALRWMDRDLPPRSWERLLAGLLLGLLPGLAWHGWHGLERGPAALTLWSSQGFSRLIATPEGAGGSWLVPVKQVLMGGWPWLPLWISGIPLAWRQRRERSGRWCLGLTLITALMVFAVRNQLPPYSLLFWPPLALVCGPVFAWMIRRDPQQEAPPLKGLLLRLPLLWSGLGALLLGGAALTAAAGLPVPARAVWMLLPPGLGLLLGDGCWEGSSAGVAGEPLAWCSVSGWVCCCCSPVGCGSGSSTNSGRSGPWRKPCGRCRESRCGCGASTNDPA